MLLKTQFRRMRSMSIKLRWVILCECWRCLAVCLFGIASSMFDTVLMMCTACADERQGSRSTTAQLHTGVGRPQHDAVWYERHVCLWGVHSVSGDNTSLLWLDLTWHYRFGGRKSIWPVKNWLMWCRHGYLSGTKCKWFAYYSAGATATNRLASLKSSMVLPFWYWLTQEVVLEKRPLNGCSSSTSHCWFVYWWNAGKDRNSLNELRYSAVYTDLSLMTIIWAKSVLLFTNDHRLYTGWAT